MLPIFTWNVERNLVTFSDAIAIRWYSLFFAGGFVLGYFMVLSWFKKEGKPIHAIDSLLVHLVVGCIVGARLGHVLFYDPAYYFSNPVEILLINKGGLASHGGFIGIAVAMALYCYRYREISFFWLTDRVAIPAIMVGGFIRLGNFFNSEIIGKPTDVSWAVIFEKVDMIPRHPAQLYEAFFYLSLSAFLYYLYRRWDRRVLEGRFFGLVFVIAYSFRFFVETFKENQEPWEAGMALNMGQILSLICIPWGLFLVTGMHHKFAFFRRGISPDGYGGGQMTSEPETAAPKSRPPKKRKRQRKKRGR